MKVEFLRYGTVILSVVYVFISWNNETIEIKTYVNLEFRWIFLLQLAKVS